MCSPARRCFGCGLSNPPLPYIICIHMTTNGIQRHPVLEALFTSRARVEVLKLFFLRSSSRHYLREIAALTGQNLRAIQREVARLEDAGLIISNIEGNRKYFQANRASPVFRELRSLMIKTAGVADRMRSTLRQVSGSILVAFIFGSFAQGAETPESDIDLLIIGAISGRELSKELSPLKEELNRELNPIIMPVDELRSRLDREDPFLTSLMDGPKIFLVGDQDDLAALAVRIAPESP